VDAAITRWENYTRREAVLAEISGNDDLSAVAGVSGKS
jgi:hypothetical protein